MGDTPFRHPQRQARPLHPCWKEDWFLGQRSGVLKPHWQETARAGGEPGAGNSPDHFVTLPDETVVGMAAVLTQDGYKAHQKLLCRMAQNLNLQIEEIAELAQRWWTLIASGPARIALPLNKAILQPVRALLQTPAFLQPKAKWVERKYFLPLRVTNTFILGSLVVAAANKKEMRGSRGPERQRSWTSWGGKSTPQPPPA